MLEKGGVCAAENPGEFGPGMDELISTMRIASMRDRGGSALIRWGC